MIYLLTSAIIQPVTFSEGVMQFLLVVGISFAAIAALASFLRFQTITGNLSLNANAESEAEPTANQFQAELLRRVGGSSAQANPLIAACVGLRAGDALSASAGEAGVKEIGEWIQSILRHNLREADVVVRLDADRIGILVPSCKRDTGVAIMNRLAAAVGSGLCRTAGGWSGHVSIFTGLVSFPENGVTMLGLIDSLEQAVADAAASDVPLQLAPIPEKTVRKAVGLLRDDEELEEDDGEVPVEAEKEPEARISPMVDPVTGVIRQDKIGSAMAKYMAGFRREGLPVTMLYLGLDHTERYIKQYGDGVRDALLHAIGELLQHETREADLLGRCAEDGFLVMMNCTQEEGMSVARRICLNARRGQVQYNKSSLRMTVSLGVAGFPSHGRTPAELVRTAEYALLETRARGGNAALLFDRSMIRERRRHNKMVDQF